MEITPDGLLTSKQVGVSSVTVIRRGLQIDIPVLIAEPATDHATIGESGGAHATIGESGGAVRTAEGLVVAYGAGAVKDSVEVTVTSLSESELPERMPDGFTFVGAFNLGLGETITERAAHLTMKVGDDVLPGTEVYFCPNFRRRTATWRRYGCWRNPVL